MKEGIAVVKTRGSEPSLAEALESYKKINGRDSILAFSTGGDPFQSLSHVSGTRTEKAGFAGMVAVA